MNFKYKLISTKYLCTGRFNFYVQWIKRNSVSKLFFDGKILCYIMSPDVLIRAGNCLLYYIIISFSFLF